MNTPPRKRHVWKLRVVMAQRGIKTATELHRRLAAYGLDLSSAHLSRCIDGRPSRISTDLLDGLTTVLECGISDLLVEEIVAEDPTTDKPGPSKPTDETAKRGKVRKLSEAPARESRREKPSAELIRQLVGPKVTALPIPGKQ